MRLLCLYILLFLTTMSCLGQNRKKLELQKERLYGEVEVVQDLLKDTQHTKQASLTDLALLGKEIESREKIIATIQQQLNLINNNIEQTNFQIDSLKNEIVDLKKEYAKLVRYTYLYQNAESTLLFLFSARGFNDAYRRYMYILYYKEYRVKQVDNIKQSQDTLFIRLETLQLDKKETKNLLSSERYEQDKLQVTKKEKNKVVRELKKQESTLTKELGEKEKALVDLNEQIELIIAQVMEEKNKEREAEKAEKKEKNKNKPIVTKKKKSSKKSLAKISAKFAAKKGKLPWPVDNGVITGKFGKNRHPVLKNISTTNNGIDITTKPGTMVNSLFDGKVTNVVFNPSFQWAVIIKHGMYFTVYANLKEVSVSKGDNVNSKQSIGMIYTDPTNNKTESHLEIWHEKEKMNPIYWIHK